jgi:predicted O-methyltransferase YrrM
MIFVDSMKKQYPIVFHYAFNMLNEGGTIIFDDMFVYGEIFCADCEIPPKYLPLVKTLRNFIQYIKHSYRHSFITIGGGVMLVGK